MKFKQIAVISLSSFLVLSACGQNDSNSKKEAKSENHQKEDELKKYKANLKAFVNRELDAYDNFSEKVSIVDASNPKKFVKTIKTQANIFEKSRKSFESQKYDAKVPEDLKDIEKRFLQSNQTIGGFFNNLGTDTEKLINNEISADEYEKNMDKNTKTLDEYNLDKVSIHDVEKYLGKETAEKVEKIVKTK
ncbi:hypothetical protein [Staphylococcus ratti]|uniref:Lipoprotein n=1 Tax=Staphylococcus ratti TaxID=2892440 RepID=A0ABY3PBI6_9STAP|nr:hypothetical protein [Staphylococcus ratti]UEX89673.1 hypothetical protein LN051_08860 [Staphylococcus ratti]